MKDLDIRLEERMNTELYYPIWEYVTQAFMNPGMLDDLQLELGDGENAYVYISSDYNDIIVDIQDDQGEELDGGGGCSLEDWNELNEKIGDYITAEQRDEMHDMIQPKVQWIYKLCFTR